MIRLLRWLAGLLFSSHAWRLKHGKLLSTLGGGIIADGPKDPRNTAKEQHPVDAGGQCALCGRASSFVLRNCFQADLPVCGGCVITAAPPTADRIVTVRRSLRNRRPFGSTTPADTEVSMVQAAPPWED